jgi:hypothetical protein
MSYSPIDKPTDYFNTKLYTGNDTDDHAITGVNFQPDFVWIKSRSAANNHNLYDVIRGVNKPLKCNSTAMEFTRTDAFKSFDSDGFTLDDDATSDEVNNNGVTYASWNWLGANGTASNSDGSITSTVSANTTAGFSIIDFTGNETNSSVGHGLGVAPSMFIMKRYTDDGYSSTSEWYTYHKSLASDKYLTLQSTSAVGTNDGSLWNTSTPVTSSVINIGFNANSNHTGNKTIIYAFAEKKGYSKFGSYAPNGSADGNFIYLGFSPAFFLVKNTNTTRNWLIFDNKRNTSNEITKSLEPNTSDAEQTDSNLKVDFLSNGVKLRGLGGDLNTGDGVQYIYMAFAEAPLVGSNFVPNNAR